MDRKTFKSVHHMRDIEASQAYEVRPDIACIVFVRPVAQTTWSAR